MSKAAFAVWPPGWAGWHQERFDGYDLSTISGVIVSMYVRSAILGSGP